MKNSFFSRFTPKEPKFFPLLKQLSEILSASSSILVESLRHDSPTERANYYKLIKDKEREGDKLTHLIFDELGTTFITPFDREDIHDLRKQSPALLLPPMLYRTPIWKLCLGMINMPASA